MAKFVLFILLALGLAGCAEGSGTYTSTQSNEKSQDVSPPQRMDVGDADSLQCPSGGQIYSIYFDQNENGDLDSGEEVINTQVVCNGQNGSDGYSTLISLLRVEMGVSVCAAGKGLQINLGLDSDRSGALDASEISDAQMVCDGQNGADGSDGADGANGGAGVNGHSVVFQSLAAPISQCAAGGSMLVMALDVHDQGYYDSSLPGQQVMTVCNGTNAPVSAYSTLEPILACGNNSPYKEVLLLLQNGQVLGSFSNNNSGDMTRLAFLPDGTFMNTDNSGCIFSLQTSSDGQSRSISWFNQVQKIWAMLN